MMTQEEFMNVKALKAAGWTVAQITRHLGYHPATISGWLKAGGPPAKRSTPVDDLVIDERWRERTAGLLAHNPELKAPSIMRVLRAEGFEGSMAAPSHRRIGLGGTLLGMAAQAAHDGGRWPILDVATHFDAAIGLYERSGWVRAGRVVVRSRNAEPLAEYVYIGPAPCASTAPTS